jgi:type VI secretion system secreted protein VgrG
MDLLDLAGLFASQSLSDAHRPIRLRLAARHGGILGKVLLLQRIDIREALFEGITGHLTCLSTRADLPLKLFTGLPLEVQIVTDRGALRPLSMIVTEVRQGQADGDLTVLQLTGRDAFAILSKRRRTRIFRDKSVAGILRTVLDEWRGDCAPLARAFDYVLQLDEGCTPSERSRSSTPKMTLPS